MANRSERMGHTYMLFGEEHTINVYSKGMPSTPTGNTWEPIPHQQETILRKRQGDNTAQPKRWDHLISMGRSLLLHR